MKKLLLTAILSGVMIALSAAELGNWKFDNGRPKGMGNPKSNVIFKVSAEKTPDGSACGEFNVFKVKPNDVVHGIQLGFTVNAEMVKGMKYSYSFQIKSDRDVTFPVSCIQNQKPWKTFSSSRVTVNANTEWLSVKREFTADFDYNGTVRVFFMLGRVPQGTTLYIGPVRLESVDTVQAYTLNNEWNMYLNPGKVDLAKISSVPAKLGDAAAEKVILANDEINLISRVKDGKIKERTVAVFIKEFDSPSAGMMQIGCAADWWFEFYVNGKHVYDTLTAGNAENDFKKSNHVFNFPVKKGKNVIAVRVLSGSNGWKFVCGKVPFQEVKKRGIITIVRGKEWRPVKMDKVRWIPTRSGVRWTNETLKPKRVTMFERIPGSALDLSQYVPKYNIDKMGRLKSDKIGNFYFENAPGKPVRLRGFNFTPNSWDHGFHAFTKQEIEAFADQIALSGMNVLRFHFLDRCIAGDSGLPKQGKNVKDLDKVFMAQNLDELLKSKNYDKVFVDRYHYLLKCLRDRGIYVMLDIFTSIGLYTGAVRPGGTYPRFDMFRDQRYRNHWKAGLDFLLKYPNPYTGKKLIDDPQLIAITFYNEQEHLFNARSKVIERFDPLWKKHRGEKAPKFNFVLLSADTEDGTAARKFLRAQIKQMNDFYLNSVKEAGFKGFVTNWDMFMRNLEGDARADLNAVAMHTYHAHPNNAPLKPANYKQKLNYGAWFKNTMAVTDQRSSIVMANYFGRAAATRVLGKPFMMTEFSHCPHNRYIHEGAAVWAAYASLQDWQMLAPHSNTVKLKYQPLKAGFDSAENLSGVDASLFYAFGWQRGDIQKAKHAVSFHVPEKFLDSPKYVGAIGSGYNQLYMLTRIGSDYRKAKNPAADLNVVPEVFSEAVSMGMYVVMKDDANKNFFTLRDQVKNLREKGILPKDNKTNVNAGIFQSETGEICSDIKKNTMTINTPRLQAAVMKESGTVKLSNLTVKANSIPCTIGVVSLDNKKSISDAGHLLLTVFTVYKAENSVFNNEKFEAELDIGEMQQLIQSGEFKFSVKTNLKAKPEVYALNRNGSRECKIPFTFKNGTLEFDLDTSKLQYGTPYFEVVPQK